METQGLCLRLMGLVLSDFSLMEIIKTSVELALGYISISELNKVPSVWNLKDGQDILRSSLDEVMGLSGLREFGCIILLFGAEGVLVVLPGLHPYFKHSYYPQSIMHHLVIPHQLFGLHNCAQKY